MLCIQYLGEGGETCVKFLKLMELSKGMADDVNQDAIVDYLTSKAPVMLDIQKMAGSAL